MTAIGSGGLPPVFVRPARVVRVVRTDRGFAVVGETYLEGDGEPVAWTVMHFGANGWTLEEAKHEADRTAADYARKVPPGFRGRQYLVDSEGRITEVLVPS